MRLCTLRTDTGEDVGVSVPGGIASLSAVNAAAGTGYGPTMLDLIQKGEGAALAATVAALPATALPTAPGAPEFGPIYRHPPKLWGVGLNYLRHADDLGVRQPTDAPGSYLRPSSTVIGYGDDILLPSQSQRVTAEAELGVVIGTTCSDVSPEDAPSVIFGYTSVLDMTAEDVIRVNPRHIPWAKAFDTFCSLGPWVVTPDEIPDLSAVRISTVVNGTTIASNQVSAMMYDPHWLVGYFSGGMVLEAGTVIATGTPGAGVIHDGDTVEALVEGVGELRNTVRLKSGPASGR
ncbi:fumarylacetoacetate hydrolase family protein [Streptacidiphilus sp. PB12-B1b]|uniref:fumarylacetoacetate hydrolase family protein n=1 Tax=Streptacidiphilus sp. PB12-B1b TaxID=2705012 RepID=UPI0015F91353|nr:fumarylacetoacetate hydrolase family protein [Streptacidiphilus sp. PB12-B1b]QMU79086.1 fumarylacetoacetate hydrolase family protein [Streptacidiphilus sp. PB12-B1b]